VRILCVCDEGNSRSPTLASRLRYRGHDTLAVGADRAEEPTRLMLSMWCERAIFTSPNQRLKFPMIDDSQVMVWPIADAYPRPFNKELLALVDVLADQEGL
jgi:hypothetical protein